MSFSIVAIIILGVLLARWFDQLTSFVKEKHDVQMQKLDSMGEFLMALERRVDDILFKGEAKKKK